MNESHNMTDTVAPVIAAFSAAFQQVLSQTSGNLWSASIAAAQEGSAAVTIIASASGAAGGEFCFRFTPETGSALAQALLMAESPTGHFEEEEKEAAIELLRQVCGHCATALSAPSHQMSFTVLGEGPQSWSAQQKFTVQLSSGERSIDVEVSLSPDFCANIQHPQQRPSPLAVAPPEDNKTKNLDLLLDIQLGVRLRFGSRRMKLREILEFHAGTIVELDRQVQEPVDLLADSKLIARGEVVVVEGNYGLKITEIVSPKQCLAAIP